VSDEIHSSAGLTPGPNHPVFPVQKAEKSPRTRMVLVIQSLVCLTDRSIASSKGHPVTAYAFSLVFPSLPSFFQ